MGGWWSLTQSLGLCLTVFLWTFQKFAIFYIETSKCFAIAHLNFLLLIHSCSESSKPLCDGCHQWIAQRRGRYLSWELGRELPASLPPSTWYWYQWRKNTITTAKTKTNKHKNKKQRYWQRQRHSDLTPRAIDQTSVDCQLPVEQMFHLTFEKNSQNSFAQMLKSGSLNKKLCVFCILCQTWSKYPVPLKLSQPLLS